MADFDVVVIGAGPGGYIAAIRAAQLGLNTAVVERGDVGGICLNWGCIPSKALLRNAEVLSLFGRAGEFGISYDNLRFDFGTAIDRSRSVVERLRKGVEFLLRKNKITVVRGEGVLKSSHEVKAKETGQVLSTNYIILATGARARTLPVLPIDGRTVVTSREALEQREVPKAVVIVGGGPTGCEFAYLYNTYGARVTLVEMLPHLLPNEDPEVSVALERAFSQQGIETLTGSKVVGMEKQDSMAQVVVEGKTGKQAIACDRVLVAVGVQGNWEDMGLETAGVAVERGFIAVDDRLRTNVENIFAIGDVTGKLLLAHVASAQGVAVAETLAGMTPPALDYRLMPRAVYCQPQVASWGLAEEEARQAGYNVKVGKFPLSASGKALALGDTNGFAKVVVDGTHGELLGAHFIGPEVTELLAELSMARLLEGTAREAGWLVHAHPTLSEICKEAALAALGEAIHL